LAVVFGKLASETLTHDQLSLRIGRLNVTRISVVLGATSVRPARGSVLTTTGGALATVNSWAEAIKPVVDRSSPVSITGLSQRMLHLLIAITT